MYQRLRPTKLGRFRPIYVLITLAALIALAMVSTQSNALAQTASTRPNAPANINDLFDTAAGTPNLGEALGCGLFNVTGSMSLAGGNSTVTGSLCVGPSTTADVSGSDLNALNGDVIIDPDAAITVADAQDILDNAGLTGKTPVVTDLDAAYARARQLYLDALAATPDFTYVGDPPDAGSPALPTFAAATGAGPTLTVFKIDDGSGGYGSLKGDYRITGDASSYVVIQVATIGDNTKFDTDGVPYDHIIYAITEEFKGGGGSIFGTVLGVPLADGTQDNVIKLGSVNQSSPTYGRIIGSIQQWVSGANTRGWDFGDLPEDADYPTLASTVVRFFGENVLTDGLQPSPSGIATVNAASCPVNTALYPASLGGADNEAATLQGPSHLITKDNDRLLLGEIVDPESNGQPTANADGDDSTANSASDDEDGVDIPGTIEPNTNATFTVTYVNDNDDATIYAFIDWNGNGNFEDAGESQSANIATGSGTQSFTFAVPVSANGLVGARFRIATQQDDNSNPVVLGPCGPAPNGEVEDYLLLVSGDADWGDLPDVDGATNPGGPNYNTDSTGPGGPAGAFHALDPDLYMGANNVDAEADGQPSAAADGDDTDGVDDEDGVTLPVFMPGANADVTITVTNNTGSQATVYGFIDFNGDGDFDDAGETASALVPDGTTDGTATLTFAVPSSAAGTNIGARFRLSTATGLGPDGPAIDGEVEDYLVTVDGTDLGDLPDTGAGTSPGNYQTLLSDSGPRHTVGGIFLGNTVDTEADGQPTAGADGDDNNGAAMDDEDGVTIPTLIIGRTATVVVESSAAGALNAFFDWNGDGDFADPGETIAELALIAGSNNLSVPVPNDAATDTPIGARFRASTGGGLASTGDAPDGEIEDYLVIVDLPELLKEVDNANAAPGDVLAYTLRTNYLGDVLLSNAVISDITPPGTTYAGNDSPAANVEPSIGGTGVVSWNVGSNDVASDGSVAAIPGADDNVRDDFDTEAYNVNDGSANWATNWIETGDDNDAQNGDIQIVGGSSYLNISMEGADGMSIQRTANLQDATTAVLSYTIDTSSNINSGDTVVVEVSVDNGSTWTTITTIDDSTPETTYTWDLVAELNPDVVSSTTVVRLQKTGGGGGESLRFEYVEIAYTNPDDPGLTTALTTSRTLVNVGDSFDVVMTASATSEVTGVTPSSLTVNPNNGAAATCGSASPVSATADAGLPAVFTWTCTATTAGTLPDSEVSFTANATGTATSSGNAANWANGTSNSVLVAPAFVFEVTVDDPFSAANPVCNQGTLTDNNVFPSGVESNEVCTDVESQPDIGAIGNYIWVDENSDGFQDAGEPGIPGVVVVLYDAAGSEIATTVTDADGGYLFSGLPAGTYYVDVQDGTDGQPDTLPFGMTQTTPSNLPGQDYGNQDHGTTSVPTTGFTGYPVTIGAGETNLTADFGYNSNPDSDVNDGTGVADLGDRIWVDADGDGVQDAGELGIPDVTLTLFYDPDGDGVYDTPYPAGTATTDAYGRYLFEDLPVDSYVVVVDDSNFAPGGALAGYGQTGDPDHFGTDAANAPAGTAGDNQTTTPVVLAPGDVFLNADFGYQPPASQNNTVGDTVWFDVDADGLYEPNGNDGNPATTSDNEYGIPGVTVALVRDTGGDGSYDPVTDPIVATTITDENGTYLFSGVPDGTYIVLVNDTDNILGALTQSGDPDAVLDDQSATDLDAAGTNSSPVVDLLQDFGYTAGTPTTPAGNDGIIGDTIFFDANANDTPDAGEGLGGVTVQLLDAGGNLIGSTVTDANGNYLFTDLPVDGDGETYTVVVVAASLPPAVINTVDPDGGFDNTSMTTISTSDPIDLDQDFGYQLPGTAGEVGDQVWLDTNSDGFFDTPTEPGIEGVTLDLILDLNGNGSADPGEPVIATETTATDGTYLFDNLPVDDGSGDIDYVVVITDEDDKLVGLTQTFGTPNTNDNGQTSPYGVTLSVGSPTDYTADFSYDRTLGSIGDTVFLDADFSGTPDAGEGIGGVVVNLLDENGDLVATTVTDGNGLYLFDGLPYGDYTVVIDTTTLPPGLENTVDPDGGFDDTSDVTIDGTTPVNLDQDFGYEPDVDSNGELGDQVWLDTTPDGVFASGSEPGIGNVTLDLIMDLNGDGVIDPGEPVIGTATTAPDGTYLFTGLPTVDNGVGPAGSDYIVTVTDRNGALTGLSQTILGTPGANDNNQADPYAISLTVGSPSNLTADFGYVYSPAPGAPLGAIGDTVWIDANNNGVQDPGEPGVGGVTITLTGPGGPLTTTTNADGTYLFSDLPLGTYTVTIDPENFNAGNPLFGYAPTFDDDGLGTPNESTTTIGTGGATPLVDLDQDFGYRPNPTNSNTVGDTIWFDADGDGEQDAGEPGIPNVTVELRDQTTGDVVGTTTTDEFGEYLFTGVPDGSYTVVVTDDNGVLDTLTQTGDPDAVLDDQSDVDLDPTSVNPVGVVDLDQDFGYQPNLGAIGDTVWVNQDGNTTQDPGEPGVGGVTVELLDGNGDVIATTTTAPDGTYLFTGLPAGDYSVRIPASNFGGGQPLEGYSPNYDDDGGNDNISSITLGAGEVNLDQDFGYAAPDAQNNSVGDYVWLDANKNGTGPSVPPADGGAAETQGDTGNPPDNGETGIAGVTVALVDSNGDVIATTETDSDGYYLFTGVPDGAYDVVVTDDNGVLAAMMQTYDADGLGTPNQSAVDLDAGSASATPVDDRAQDFGYVPQESVTNPNPTGTIGDTIFWDTNGNGAPDPGEGLAGVDVTIEFPDGSTQTTTTDENGVYVFSDLPVDGDGETYTVTVDTADIPAGLTNTVDPDGGNDSTSTTTISSGSPTDLDQDFGYAGNGTVGNLVWLDTNADGFNDGPNGPDGTPSTDDDEPGIAGVTLTLYHDADGNGALDPGEQCIGTTTTDANGNYQFSGLTTDDGGGDASYVVKVTDNDGVLNGYWHSLRPALNAGDDNYSQVDPYGQGDFNLTPGAPSNQTGDFGYYVRPAAVGNRTWIDVNGDGIQNAGEPPLPGVPVTLTISYPNDPATVVLNTVTDADGFYDFGGLLLDEDYNTGGGGVQPTYEITFGQIGIYQPTQTGQGGPLEDNDWDGSTPVPAVPVQGVTDTTLLTADPNAEEEIASYDAGFVAIIIPPDGDPQFPDLGDLPEPLYPTLFASNGAAHIIGDLYMGDDIDADNDGQPNTTATGDDGLDTNSLAPEQRSDEDGVTALLSEWDNGPGGGSVDVVITDNGAGDGGWLKAWFDFNEDGVFDTVTSVAVSPGTNTILVDVPDGTFLPDGSLGMGAVGVYARFRLFDAASDPGIGVTGLAVNGEVEDYFWSFSPTAVTLRSAESATNASVNTGLFIALFVATLVTLLAVRWQMKEERVDA